MSATGLSYADWKEAVLLVAKAEAEQKPCPRCGGATEVDMLDVSNFNGPVFVPGDYRCVARCFESDPTGYLKATATQRAAYQVSMQSRIDAIAESMSPAKKRRWWR